MIPDMLKEKKQKLLKQKSKNMKNILYKDYLMKVKNRPVSPTAHIELDLKMIPQIWWSFLTYLEVISG